ncbi:MAG: carbohydrate-binding protein [Oscillospiraceae bacterium]|nr:carbohydrate-binding protein [Oscillospiraceae bacterium]
MAKLKLKLLDKNNHTLLTTEEGENVSMVYTGAYQEGDSIHVETDTEGLYCMFWLEDTLPESIVYCKERVSIYKIPFGTDRIVFSPKAFMGTRHLIRARMATPQEIAAYRNLALNPYDTHGDNGFFPHASANVETRGEAVFAAYNAIDGIFENASHGEWPYQSWGINRDPNAAITIDFGRTVKVDAAALTLRADFPHDSYWTQATLSFSDGSKEVVTLKKTDKPQHFAFSARSVERVTLSQLIKAEDESPFPALTQLEVFGHDER